MRFLKKKPVNHYRLVADHMSYKFNSKIDCKKSLMQTCHELIANSPQQVHKGTEWRLYKGRSLYLTGIFGN